MNLTPFARKLAVVVVAAFLLRAGAGALLAHGVPALGLEPRDWWSSGYSHYAEIARTFLETGEYRVGPYFAPRPPLYPLLLAGLLGAFGASGLAPVLVQSAIGAGTVGLTALVARRAFDEKAGLVAGAIAAVYPYAVVHDTALQETTLAAVLAVAAVERLLAARETGALAPAAASGLLVGLALLARESLLPVLPVAALWLLLADGVRVAAPRLGAAGAFLGLALLVVSPWLVRSARRVGAPVFAAGTGFGLGYRLWVANNPHTLDAYPARSIDLSTDRAFAALTPSDAAALSALDANRTDSWYRNRALAYVREAPGRFLEAGAVKLLAGLGPLPSPRGGPLRDAGYAAAWIPLAVAALAGLVLFRGTPFGLLAGALLAVFSLTTFVFHAHTAHRAWLDPVLVVLAAGAVVRAAARADVPVLAERRT